MHGAFLPDNGHLPMSAIHSLMLQMHNSTARLKAEGGRLKLSWFVSIVDFEP
jgi:hypothetical protein